MKDEVVLFEHERWSVRRWSFGSNLLPIDPRSWTDASGAACTIAEADSSMALRGTATPLAVERPPEDSCRRPPPRWRWQRTSSWSCGPWMYAFSFAGPVWTSERNKASFVRKRRWSRHCESLPPQGGGGKGVRFAEDTAFERELPAGKWRACVARRNSIRWLRKYREDCDRFGLSLPVVLGALLGAEGHGAFYRQMSARKLLAGRTPWPDSPARFFEPPNDRTTLTALAPHCEAIFEQLMAETPEVGFGEACATALQTLAMVVVNRAARSSSGDAADHAGDDAALRDGGDAVSGLMEYIGDSIERLELERVPEESPGGYESASGWFVVDDDFGAPQPRESGIGARGALGGSASVGQADAASSDEEAVGASMYFSAVSERDDTDGAEAGSEEEPPDSIFISALGE